MLQGRSVGVLLSDFIGLRGKRGEEGNDVWYEIRDEVASLQCMWLARMIGIWRLESILFESYSEEILVMAGVMFGVFAMEVCFNKGRGIRIRNRH